MSEFLQDDTVKVVLLLAFTAAMLAVGLYIILKVRKAMRDEEPNTSDLLSNFRDIHSRGALSDEEFRVVKNKLGAQLRQELKTKQPER